MRRLFPWFAVIAMQGTSPAQDSSFEKTVLPILRETCVDCHGGKSPKGGINFEALEDPSALQRHDVRMWSKVREQLRARTMPPPDKDEIEPADSNLLLAWIQDHEKTLLVQPAANPGPARTRRLNREEYSNTLRDLLGVRQRYGEMFPADGSGGEGFTNNADTLIFPPIVIESHFTAAEQAIDEVWADETLRNRLTKTHLPAFLQRAYRRPPSDQEIRRLRNIFDIAKKQGRDDNSATRAMFTAVLINPGFLFLEETTTGSPRQLTSYEMASRLSYFIWASMPDDELLSLASQNKLQDDNVIATQVKRLLADEKAVAFTKNFTSHWLGLEEFINSSPDGGRFPFFTPEIRDAMHEEIFLFSDHLMRRNGNVLEFIDSDYTYLNESLAKYYSIPGVTGQDFRRVTYPDKRRGGLTGMGAVLTLTSYPLRTGAVRRGKWVIEQLLGTPAPAPPPNVGQIPGGEIAKTKSLRQRLEDHRSKPACAGCHVRLDPPGFGLENFDAIGQWRDLDEFQRPLDTTGELPGGRKFSTPEEFRNQLMTDKNLFARNLCFKLLGYSLGRSLEISDHPSVLRLEEILRNNDYRSEALIIAVARSYPFRWRK